MFDVVILLSVAASFILLVSVRLKLKKIEKQLSKIEAELDKNKEEDFFYEDVDNNGFLIF
jgi:hypothetical protein